MGASGSELRALKIVQEEAGETGVQVISRKMRVDTNYARLLCTSLARADYLDFLGSGKLKLTHKGKSILDGIFSLKSNQEKSKKGVKNKTPNESAWESREGSRIELNRNPYPAKREEEGWVFQPIEIGKPYRRRGVKKAGQILRDEIYPCGFCEGTGEKPRGSKCSVCGGKGEVSLEPPVVMCAYCKGRGEEHPRTNVTCTACRGKGFISVTEPLETCSHCQGTGTEPTNKLPCIVCRGKGVVTKPEAREPAPSSFYAPTKEETKLKRKKFSEDKRSKPGGGVTASELEALEVFRETQETKKPLNVSDYTGMSPGYVNMLISSLVRKGFLTSIGARQYKITEEGKRVLKRQR